MSATWHCKKAGGLFLGFKINFPIRIVPSAENYDLLDKIDFYNSILIKFGLLFFTIHFEIKYNHSF